MKEFLEAIEPELTALAVGFVSYFVVMMTNAIRKKLNLESEFFSRDALHKAVESGILLGLANARKDDIAAARIRSEVTATAVAYVRRSVPDAIKKLRASDEILFNLVASKSDDLVKDLVEEASTKPLPSTGALR